MLPQNGPIRMTGLWKRGLVAMLIFFAEKEPAMTAETEPSISGQMDTQYGKRNHIHKLRPLKKRPNFYYMQTIFHMQVALLTEQMSRKKVLERSQQGSSWSNHCLDELSTLLENDETSQDSKHDKRRKGSSIELPDVLVTKTMRKNQSWRMCCWLQTVAVENQRQD